MTSYEAEEERPKKKHRSRRHRQAVGTTDALPPIQGATKTAGTSIDAARIAALDQELLEAEMKWRSTLQRMASKGSSNALQLVEGATSLVGSRCDGAAQLATLKQDPEAFMKRVGEATIPGRFLPPLRQAADADRERRLASMHAWWATSISQVAEMVSKDMPLCRGDGSTPPETSAEASTVRAPHGCTSGMVTILASHPAFRDAPARMAEVSRCVSEARRHCTQE